MVAGLLATSRKRLGIKLRSKFDKQLNSLLTPLKRAFLFSHQMNRPQRDSLVRYCSSLFSFHTGWKHFHRPEQTTRGNKFLTLKHPFWQELQESPVFVPLVLFSHRMKTHSQTPEQTSRMIRREQVPNTLKHRNSRIVLFLFLWFCFHTGWKHSHRQTQDDWTLKEL